MAVRKFGYLITFLAIASLHLLAVEGTFFSTFCNFFRPTATATTTQSVTTTTTPNPNSIFNAFFNFFGTQGTPGSSSTSAQISSGVVPAPISNLFSSLFGFNLASILGQNGAATTTSTTTPRTIQPDLNSFFQSLFANATTGSTSTSGSQNNALLALLNLFGQFNGMQTTTTRSTRRTTTASNSGQQPIAINQFLNLTVDQFCNAYCTVCPSIWFG